MTQYGTPQSPTPAGSYGPSWQVPSFAPVVRYEPAAIVAFVLALTSFVIWILPAIVAIAMGQAAKRNIDASNGLRRGRGLATTAQVISFITIALAVVAFGALLVR